MENNLFNKPTQYHTNTFIELDDIPYLLADYLDKRDLQKIDRSVINSYINIDQSESMRAVIDISVSNMGTTDNANLRIIGNNAKERSLVESIKKNYKRLDHKLPVLRKGIIVRINYQLENNRTGEIIRTTSEDFRIPQGHYFIDINNENINDNGLVVNFHGTSVSTMNNFTHGRDAMIIRVTSVSLYYELATHGNMNVDGKVLQYETGFPHILGNNMDMYEYHRLMQTQNVTSIYPAGVRTINTLTPPYWFLYNHFYHFSEDKKDIILHKDEVYDINLQTGLIPCGMIMINRAFVINPCHRIIFKFNIWRNDMIAVADTTNIADALKPPVLGNPSDKCNCGNILNPNLNNCNCQKSPWDSLNNPNISNLFNRESNRDYSQNKIINLLIETVLKMNNSIKELKGEKPDDLKIPKLPEKDSSNCGCGNSNNEYTNIINMINQLRTEIHNNLDDDEPMDKDTVIKNIREALKDDKVPSPDTNLIPGTDSNSSNNGNSDNGNVPDTGINTQP